jgi:hypothetical protein
MPCNSIESPSVAHVQGEVAVMPVPSVALKMTAAPPEMNADASRKDPALASRSTPEHTYKLTEECRVNPGGKVNEGLDPTLPPDPSVSLNRKSAV